ncbi:phosphatase PAP2 family protein [Kitasatospora sp. NPDC059088]|uniref:phosphatase PAP2 family protein n=1 Tax=unclassified Kitasatospora TaxID=2633591 RepID=UPI0036B35D51
MGSADRNGPGTGTTRERVRRGEAAPAGRAEPPLVVLHGWLGLASGLAALVVVLLGAWYAGKGEPGPVDGRIQDAVYGVEPPWRYAARGLDSLGEPLGAALLVGAVAAGCLLLRRPRAAVFAVVGVALPVLAATLLKHLVGRTIHGDANLSYPSGHTAFLTAVTLVLALLAAGPNARPLPVLAAVAVAGAAMAWAQVALGAHYATDTLAGGCTALALVPPAGWLVDRAADRLAARSAPGDPT